MLPYISIGDLYLPFFSIGFSITCLIFLFLSFKSLRKYGINENDAINIPTIICIVSILFSKIPLGLIYRWDLIEYAKFWKTGHTLVGVLIISTAAIIVYTLVRKIKFIDIVAGLVYPSFFALSSYRLLVCFTVGCCYGFESQKYGIVFSPESFAGNGNYVKLFPTQIVESALFFFSGIIIYKLKNLSKEKIIITGLLLLILERFIAEQIRADIKEKIIKFENFGISIWFLALLIILIITDIYLNLVRYWINDIKRAEYKMREDKIK